MIVGGDARPRLERQQNRGSIAYEIDRKRFHRHAGDDLKPASLVPADGARVLGRCGGGAEDASAQPDGGSDRFDRLGHDGVEQRQILDRESLSHFTPAANCLRNCAIPSQSIVRAVVSGTPYFVDRSFTLNPLYQASSTNALGVASIGTTAAEAGRVCRAKAQSRVARTR